MIILGSYFTYQSSPLYLYILVEGMHSRWLGPQTREYIDWRWPFSCVNSFMMVFSAQLAEDGVHIPTPFTLSTPTTRITLPPPKQEKKKEKKIIYFLNYSNRQMCTYVICYQLFPEAEYKERNKH